MLDDSLTAEHTLYGPILDVLRSIMNAVDTVRAAHNLGSLGTNFCDSHRAIIPGDGPNTHLLKPDLVLFEDQDPRRRSWETLMMTIEVKAKATYLKVGMKRLSQYAHTVFAHQIHRRHLYGMVICKWSATFVRFDRSGIVHSEPMDMLDNPKEFRKAFAGLMMLDRNSFGYDTAFTIEYTPGGRLEYYVDLPATAFPSDITESVQKSQTLRKFPTRRLKVMERLCHRKSICGSATIVLRLREVHKPADEPESGELPIGRMTRSRTRLQQSQRHDPKWELVPGGRDYVLKLVWRELDKRQEGEMLRCLYGEYGVVQCQWYSDILQWGASCHEPEATSCDVCCDMTPAQEVRRVENLGDPDVRVIPEHEGEEPQHVEVITDEHVEESYTHRMPCVYSWTLFLTLGRPLRTAESPRQFLEAVLDAVLGYWQAFNRGIIHRDISVGNVLIADRGRGYERCNWKPARVDTGGSTNDWSAEPLTRRIQKTAARSDSETWPRHTVEWSLKFLAMLPESVNIPASRRPTPKPQLIQRHLPSDLGENTMLPAIRRHPLQPMYKKKEQLEEHNHSSTTMSKEETYKLIDYHIGTPPFMPVRVSRLEEGATYEHHFTDDLESFFWLILWCVAEYADSSSDESGSNSQRTVAALTLLNKLDRKDSDLSTTADSKLMFLSYCADREDHSHHHVKRLLQSYQNTWANNPGMVDVIFNLGTHFFKTAFECKSFLKCTPAVEFPTIVRIISEGLESV